MISKVIEEGKQRMKQTMNKRKAAQGSSNIPINMVDRKVERLINAFNKETEKLNEAQRYTVAQLLSKSLACVDAGDDRML